MGGKSKSSQSQSTTATQTTTNNDNSLTASDQGTVIGGTGAQITINDLSADVAGAAITMAGTTAQNAFQLSKDTTATAFDFLTGVATEQKYLAQKNQELTASLATKSFDLADEKSQSADDKVFSFGKTILYVVGGIVALLILFSVFKKKPAANA